MSDPALLLSSAEASIPSEVVMISMPEVSAIYTGVCFPPRLKVMVSVRVPPRSRLSDTVAPAWLLRAASFLAVNAGPVLITAIGTAFFWPEV